MRRNGLGRYVEIMVTLFLAVALANPSPSPVPQTIITVQSRELCSLMRERLTPAIGGLLANDHVVAQAQTVLEHWRNDARQEYGDDVGGSGAAFAMDNLRAENAVSGLVANIEKIQQLLDGAQFRGANREDASRFEAARSRLQAVLAEQKAELNLLSFVSATNQARDLQAKGDPTGGIGRPPASLAVDVTPVSLPQQLYLARLATQQREIDATDAIAPITETCGK